MVAPVEYVGEGTLDTTMEYEGQYDTQERFGIIQEALNSLLKETESVADRVARLISSRKTENENLSADVDYLQEEVEFLQKKNYEDCNNLNKAIKKFQYQVEEARQVIMEKEEIIKVQQRFVASKQEEIEEQYVFIDDLRQNVRDLRNQLEIKQIEKILAQQSVEEEFRALGEIDEQLHAVDKENVPERPASKLRPKGFLGCLSKRLLKVGLCVAISTVSAANQARTFLYSCGAYRDTCLWSCAHELLDTCCSIACAVSGHF
ncbi:hypothetical protein EXN66_Car009237 [Channa argus]|uniref:Uncharacterized protein n=1 Tax=Channa argus TaxID=215402 RepID=A0A6G1PT97_CHAAH|nr:hypothetical protein EXN66_Car009237 [Channa argus]